MIMYISCFVLFHFTIPSLIGLKIGSIFTTFNKTYIDQNYTSSLILLLLLLIYKI